MGQPGPVGFREGFLEEVMSRMNPDWGARVGQEKKGGKDSPGGSTQEGRHRSVGNGGSCKLAAVPGTKGVLEQGLGESRGQASEAPPSPRHASCRGLGLCSVEALSHLLKKGCRGQTVPY